MKIAIIHPSLEVKGGAENVVVWLAEGLSRRGHEVVVITTDLDASFYGDPAKMGFTVVQLSLGGYSIRIRDWIKAGWILRKRLDGFDILNPHNFPSYIWVFFARLFGARPKRVVWYCEEPFRYLYRSVTDRHTAELTRRIVAPVQQVNLFKAFLPALRKRGIKVIASVIGAVMALLRRKREPVHMKFMAMIDRAAVGRLDEILSNSEFIAGHVREIFGRSARKCLLGLPTSRAPRSELRQGDHILMVSRLHFEKNVGTAIEAMKEADGHLPGEARLLIAGSGPLASSLRDKVDELEIGHRVELLGFVDEDRLQDLFADALAVLYISLDETFGLPFLEAAAARKAVIGPDHGGPTELIVEGVTGLCVDALDPKAVADAVVTMYRDRQAATEMGQAGFERLMAEFTFDHFLDRFEHLVLAEAPDGS